MTAKAITIMSEKGFLFGEDLKIQKYFFFCVIWRDACFSSSRGVDGIDLFRQEFSCIVIAWKEGVGLEFTKLSDRKRPSTGLYIQNVYSHEKGQFCSRIGCLWIFFTNYI